MKLLRISHRQAGFTLIELLVATAVTGVIIVMVMDFMANTVKDNAIATTRDSLLSDAQIGLDNIGDVIRLSGDADTASRWPDNNSPGGASQAGGWLSSSNTLVLATAAVDNNHNVIFQDPLHYVSEKNNDIYFVSNGTLYRRVLADPVSGNTAKTSCPAAQASSTCPSDSELMHNVTSFSVSYIDGNGDSTTPDDARAIGLSITLQTVKYNQTIKASYSTRTVFRND